MDRLLFFIQDFAGSIWSILLDSAFLLLLGIFLAGVIHLLLSGEKLTKLLKGGKNAAVVKAALFGVPLPLCSCSVLPVAQQLRNSGLNKGATASFLISTPETGVDSVALTYSLMDPLMTVARPISAFLTALAAGVVINLGSESEKAASPDTAGPACTDCCSESPVETRPVGSVFGRLLDSLRYAFVDLLGDLAIYLVVGYLLAGLVAAVLGEDILGVPESLRSGWGAYLGAIIVGLPLYICATASTPLAAVLLVAGFSPGAIMVFLLVGPATNAASLAVVRKILGGEALVRYLAVIVLAAIMCGLAVDAVYGFSGYRPVYRVGEHAGVGGIVSVLSAVVFSVYVTWLAVRKLLRRPR